MPLRTESVNRDTQQPVNVSVPPAAPAKSKLSDLLASLDTAVTEAESLAAVVEKKTKEAAEASAKHEVAVKSVQDLQVQLRERLGSVVGGDSGRVRVS